MVRNFKNISFVFSFLLILSGCGSPANVFYKGQAVKEQAGVANVTQAAIGSEVGITLGIGGVGAQGVQGGRFITDGDCEPDR